LCGRVNLEREPNVPSYEKRRKPIVPSITKNTLICGKDIYNQVENYRRQNDEVLILASSNASQAICRIFKGEKEDWRLQCLQGEVFMRLEPRQVFELKDGMCFRFGSASVVTILRQH